MKFLRKASSLVLFFSLVMVWLGGPVIAQDAPDFGDPPETLTQVDDGGLGRQMSESPEQLAIVNQSQQLLILIGAVGIALGALLFMLVTKQRRSMVVAEPSGLASHDARDAVLRCANIPRLVEELVSQATTFAGASAAFATIHGRESAVGETLDLPTDLIVRANQSKALVQDGGLTVMPVLSGGAVVGLLAMRGGSAQGMSALGKAAGDVYVGLAARTGRFAADGVSATADVDGLTGVGNRRRFDNDIARVGHVSEDGSAPVSLVIFDVDNFHFYNEAHGKHAGNDVLRSIADLIADNLRDSDVVYRYGGVQFVALLPDASAHNACQVAERIRHVVENTDFYGEQVQPSGRITISIGIADAPGGESVTLLGAADMALVHAKESGRNKVVTQDELP